MFTRLFQTCTAACCGLALFAWIISTSQCQEAAVKAARAKDDPEPGGVELRTRYKSLVRAGYTRPGSPEDRLTRTGKIIPALLDPERDPADPVIGGTVYFAVFRLAGHDDEIIDGEIAGLGDKFVPGRNFENSFSPGFDSKAKYLYVYQIVNDRGLDPATGDVTWAFDKNLDTAKISSFALRLVVDPRYITSWGAFKNSSFVAQVPGRNRKGEIVPMGDDKAKLFPVAFSSDPSILAEVPEKRYMDGSPAYRLGELMRDFGVGVSNLNLARTPNFQLISAKKDKDVSLLNWEGNGLAAAIEGGTLPDFVQLIVDADREAGEPTLEGRPIGSTIFRVDFRRDNSVGAGAHSVVFGFTTDLPPRDEPIRIEGFSPVAAKAAGEGLGNAVATGNAPTPVGAAPMAFGAMPFGGSLGGSIGGGLGGGGGGGVGIPGAGFGVASVPGGGSGGGTGGGQGDGGGGAQQGEDQDQDENQGQNQNQVINFNVTQTNNNNQTQSQSQSQSQQQQQQQQQSQNQSGGGGDCCCHGDNGNVVPAPPALLLGLLGLPAFFLLKRRRTPNVADSSDLA